MPKNRYYSGPVSDHFAGEGRDSRFFNTAPPTSDRGLADIIKWRRSSQPTKWPESVPVRTVVPDATVDAARITLVGHATVLIQVGGRNLLTDPVWSQRASPFSLVGPRRVCRPGVEFDALPRIDAVLLSHNHYDHLDVATLRRLVKRDDPLIVTPLGNDTIVKRAIPRARVHTGDWWDEHRLPGGIDITFVPAQHWSARGVLDRRMALWCGFFVRSGNDTIYFAGDTGYGDGSLFTKIRARLGSPDVALLPIGAYAPRWFMADQHIDPAQAVHILEDLDAGQGLAIHWGVFPLSDEGRDEPATLLAQVLVERGLPPTRFTAAEPGAVHDLRRQPLDASERVSI